MDKQDKTFMKSGFDVAGDLEYTTDHRMIRRWVSRWHGHPAVDKSSDVAASGGGQREGALRIRLPHATDEHKLQEISWDEFFRRFEAEHLALEYLDEPRSTVKGQPFARLVDRRTVQADSQTLSGLSGEDRDQPSPSAGPATRPDEHK
jgi:hypothetical protein